MLTCISVPKPTLLTLAVGWCHLYKRQWESLRRQGLWSLVFNIAMDVSKWNFKDIVMKKPHFKELNFREESCYKAKEPPVSERLLYHLFCCSLIRQDLLCLAQDIPFKERSKKECSPRALACTHITLVIKKNRRWDYN